MLDGWTSNEAMYTTRGQLLAPLDTSQKLDSLTASTALDTTEHVLTLDSLDPVSTVLSSCQARQSLDSCRQLPTVIDNFVDSLDSQGSGQFSHRRPGISASFPLSGSVGASFFPRILESPICERYLISERPQGPYVSGTRNVRPLASGFVEV